MRIVSTVLKVLVGLGVLVLLSYLVINLTAVAAGVLKRHRVADEVTIVLGRIVPSAEQAQGELVDSVAVLISRPSAPVG